MKLIRFLTVFTATAVFGLLALAAPGQATIPATNGQIVFGYDEEAGPVFVANPDGLASCCPFRSGDGSPSYSPDRSLIVFTRFNQKGQVAVFTMNAADGTGVYQVTPWGLGGGGGRWSPDGQWIVLGVDSEFHHFRGELFLVHPDGTALHKIPIDTHGSTYFAKEPTWSPDGSRILFVMYLSSNNQGQPDLFTVNPDGSHLVQVTDTPETENVPSWGTLPLAT
jgi:Tol biopolymer transport system component